jgi:hypothetical protein
MRIGRWAFMIFLIAPLGASSALAQDQQDDSVAAAARRAQEQKKSQAKSAKVWDNDTLPATGAVNVVGQEPSAETAAATGTGASNATVVESKPAPTAAEKTALDTEVSAAKARLADIKADLDIMQRKYTLDQQSYYAKPDYASDKAGPAALASEKSDIDAKADEVAAAEKALADAQSKLDAASKASADQDAAAKAAAAQAAANPAPAPPPAKPPVPSDQDQTPRPN